MRAIPLSVPGQALPSSSVTITPGTVGSINFTNPRSKELISPIAEAISNTAGSIKVCAVCFTDSSQPTPAFTVYQNNAIAEDGGATVQFFIEFNAPETAPKSFNAYELTFPLDETFLPANIVAADITQVQIFLWNSDPIASRGTITNVQHG